MYHVIVLIQIIQDTSCSDVSFASLMDIAEKDSCRTSSLRTWSSPESSCESVVPSPSETIMAVPEQCSYPLSCDIGWWSSFPRWIGCQQTQLVLPSHSGRWHFSMAKKYFGIPRSVHWMLQMCPVWLSQRISLFCQCDKIVPHEDLVAVSQWYPMDPNAIFSALILKWKLLYSISVVCCFICSFSLPVLLSYNAGSCQT